MELFKELAKLMRATEASPLRIAGVEFWIDAVGPWAGQLAFSVPTSKWNPENEMTITKTSHRAQQVLDGARNIRCYSLSNGFSGEPLAERPVIWGELNPGDTHRPLVEVSQIGFLRHELKNRTTKLVDSGNGHYTIRVHSNLWFSFQSA